ncbi:Hypothetical protein FKW44_023188, partial [Caligus rogercresseyi]
QAFPPQRGGRQGSGPGDWTYFSPTTVAAVPGTRLVTSSIPHPEEAHEVYYS